MKMKVFADKRGFPAGSRPVTGSLLCAGMLALTTAAALADHDGYNQVNLASDEAGVAMLQDTNLVNAWGMSFSATSPFWVSANGTELAVLYAVTNDPLGGAHIAKQGLEVAIPGAVTGQVFNNTAGFNHDAFLFATEDGTIAGWRGALGTTAEVLTNKQGAVYKGLALYTNGTTVLLLGANFAEGSVDAYDGNMNLVGQFMDMDAPSDYAPFNVQTLNGMVFVTFAKRNDATLDDVSGRGHGLIDILDPVAGTFQRFATGSDAGGRLNQINSPWGLAIAPASFGEHGDQLLVGNFGSGTIMSFDAHGRFRGLLEGRHEKPIVIDGLWGLTFGNGGRGGVPSTLYFSAGPDDESHGLFGSLEPVAKRHGGHDEDNGRD